MYALSVGLVIGASNLAEEVRASIHDLPVQVVMEQREIGDWPVFLEKLTAVGADVLLVGHEHLSGSIEDGVRRIKATSRNPKVVIVHDSADPQTILRAIRAGADEYLYPPLKNDLRHALKKMSADLAAHRSGLLPRGKVVGFLSAKGGCGATTVACHVAVELHHLTNREVLLADFDLDSGMVSFLMKSQGRYSVMDAVANAHRLDLSFWKALVSNGTPGVEIITAPQSGAVRGERNLDDFRAIVSFLRSNYDWSVADLGRSLNPLAMSLIEEMDETYVITTLDVPALHQAKEIVQTLIGAGCAPHRLRILLNRMPKRSEVTLEELDRMLGVPIFATLRNDYVALNDAYSEGALLPRHSKLGLDFARVAAKISGLQPKKKKGFLS